MNYLILVRHSQSNPTPELPSHRWRLSAEGERRAKIAGRILKRYTPFTLASSPEPKALQTALAITDHYPVPIIEHHNLREHDRHTVTWFGSEAEFKAAVQRFYENPHDLVLGEETAHQAGERFTHAIQDLFDQHPKQTLVVVTHGSVITLFLQRTLGYDPVSFWQRLPQPWIGIFTLKEAEVATLELEQIMEIG